MEMAEKNRMKPGSLLYALNAVQPHQLIPDAVNHFSGFVLDYTDVPVVQLEIYAEDEKLHSFSASEPSPDIHTHVPHLQSAGNCRFACDFYVDGQVSVYTFKAVYADGSRQILCEYPVSRILAAGDWLRNMDEKVARIARPDPDLIFLTQGIHDADAYQHSIIPGIYNLKRYLGDAGVDPAHIQTILDMGCGTGRLLVGWYLDNTGRDLFGCDINEKLITWARQNLPAAIQLSCNSISGSLSYPAASFDLIQLISVFTHLSISSQQEWVKELQRLVRPGGCVLVTLHGETYVQLFHPEKHKDFLRTGYLEITTHEEGSNSFGTYHTPAFADRLFQGFDLLKYYPRGSFARPEVIFPVAAFQDVYVLKRR